MAQNTEEITTQHFKLVLSPDRLISTFIHEHHDMILAEWELGSFEADSNPIDVAIVKLAFSRLLQAFCNSANPLLVSALETPVEKGIEWISTLRRVTVCLWSRSARSFNEKEIASTLDFHSWIDQCILASLTESRRLREEQIDLARSLIGHDLMTPVSAMMLSAQCLNISKDDSSSREEAVQAMVRSGNLASRIAHEASEILAWDGRLKLRSVEESS